MKNILIHVRNEEALNSYIKMLENKEWDENITYSREVRQMIEEFYTNNWGIYLTTIHNWIDGVWNDVYFLNENKKMNMDIEQINSTMDFMMIRNLGSVEGNFQMIARYLDFIISNYKGIALNNPKAMRKGMTKDYLVEIDRKELEELGMLTIPTKIYNKNISYNDIKNEYTELDKYLIKPVTGELSNSLKCLKDIDEEFLRYKENKVGGWVVQPIKNEIWNGEYQLVFVDGKLIYGQKKNYQLTTDSNIPSQKDRIIEKYHPSENEVKVAQNIIKYFTKFYNIKIDICRIDFMKNNAGQLILIEFEMVNPGFFIGYMNKNDEDIKNIVEEIRNYCENYNKLEKK